MIKYLYFLFFLDVTICHAQNLVSNGNFEEYKKCPFKIGELDRYLNYWFSPTYASPDYFNNCTKNRQLNPNRNESGRQTPHSGDGYVGIIVLSSQLNMGGREYISVKLKEPTVKKQLYCVSMFVSLAENSIYYSNRMGFYFSEKRINQKNSDVIGVTPTINNNPNTYLNNYQDWVLISDTITFTNSFKYLTIGNFFDNSNTERKKLKIKNKLRTNFYENNTYYYIDDVSVLPISSARECACAVVQDTTNVLAVAPLIKHDSISVGKTLVLTSVYFNNNSSELLAVSYAELTLLVSYLQAHSSLTIAISGHTDDIGKEESNQLLSTARAQAVANYLIQHGILATRISCKGYGSSQPLQSNTTDEGRAQNRRVEFIIK